MSFGDLVMMPAALQGAHRSFFFSVAGVLDQYPDFLSYQIV